MKNLLILALLGVSLLFTSCDSDEGDIVDPASLSKGAVLTTVSVDNDIFDKDSIDDSGLSVTFTFRDFIENNSLELVNVYLLYADTNPNDQGQVTNIDEIQIDEFTLDDFSTNEEGLPEITYTLSGMQIMDELDELDFDTVLADDLFVVRFEAVLNDGRVFSANNVGRNVSSTSHLSPFRYSVTVTD